LGWLRKLCLPRHSFFSLLASTCNTSPFLLPLLPFFRIEKKGRFGNSKAIGKDSFFDEDYFVFSLFYFSIFLLTPDYQIGEYGDLPMPVLMLGTL
jgi:hypothetical protein